MNTLLRSLIFILLAGALSPVRLTAAPSLLLSPQPGWNGWQVTAAVKSGFREHGGAGESAGTNSGLLNIAPFGTTPGMVFTMPAASVSRLPGSGAAKDKAEGAVSFTYRTGAAAETDTFSFNINATTSAMSAKQNFGAGLVPADAFFECELVLKSFAPLTGGTLRLPDMPVLTAAAPSVESLTAIFTGPLDGYALPGYAGFEYPLTLTPAHPTFTYTVTYSVVTPYGADPVVSYRIGGLAGASPPAPLPAPTVSEESVRREMPVVKLNRLFYDDATMATATVTVQEPGDAAAHKTLIFVCPDSGDMELATLTLTGANEQSSAPVEIKVGGAATQFDGKLNVPPGKSFSALYAYALSGRITPDNAAGLKPTEKFMSADFGFAFDPAFSQVQAVVTPQVALTGAQEENPPPGMRRTGTLGMQGQPGFVQIASAELICAPRDAAQLTEFLARAGATLADNDAEWQGQNATPVWHRVEMKDTPVAEAARQDRVRFLPQLLALTGKTGTLHASNPRVLALFATALELYLEGFNCAVNPRVLTDGQLTAPEGRSFAPFFPEGPLPPAPFDSMTSPLDHFDDPRQNLRDLWAEAAMQDSDAQTIDIAFIDSAFAPNPDFRGFPNDIPQFNMETGERGPHVAEQLEIPLPIRPRLFHGNGTVAVAAGVMGNGYGLAGTGGQIVQPMLYYMGLRAFAFEMGQAMELAVADGADVINISAGYPCRILTVLGPVRICAAEERAALVTTISALVAASAAAVCATAPLLDAILPGLGATACAGATTAAVTAVSALFESLFFLTAIGDPRQPMERGVAAAKAAGIPVVASAGNKGAWPAGTEAYFDTTNCRADDWEQVPGVIPDVICASSVPPTAPYPNTQFHGPAVDLWAPEGQPVLLPADAASLAPENIAPDRQVVRNFTGSSAAAPFISGVIAHMMAINPSLDPHRASVAQKATLVTRLTNMLRATATMPGAVPEVPVSSPTDPEVARRGPMVNALAARSAARDNAGVPAMSAGGFNPRFARFDDETAGLPNDGFPIEQLGGADTSPPMTPRFGGLPHGDVDTWWMRLSQFGSVVPSAVLNVFVPNSTGPPPFIFNHAMPVPIAATTATETRYDIALRGCDFFRISLSAARPAPGSTMLRRQDVLYRLEISGHSSFVPRPPDIYEGGSGNDDAAHATSLSGSGWSAYSGPASVICSTGSKERVVSNLSLHGCEDVDWFRINPWAGYDAASASWGELKAEIIPPTPGVHLQFFEEVDRGGGTIAVEPAGRPGDGGGAGLSINANTHPLPLLLKIDGNATTNFALKLTFCMPSATFIDAAAGGSSARGGRNGAMEFWDTLRELRFLDFSIPMTFDPDLTGQMPIFNWASDFEGRSLQGQLLLMHHSGGDFRVGAIPGNPDASIRLDLTSADDIPLDGMATADLEGYDGNVPGLDYKPQGAQFVFEQKNLPAGDYLLAVSGFKLTDSWTIVPGLSSSLPGYAVAENLQGLPPQQGQMPSNIVPVSGHTGSALERLTGTPFDLHQLQGLQLNFTPPPNAAWRLEYSADGNAWSESGRASNFPGGAFALPPPGGFYRVRSIWPRRTIASSTMPVMTYAVPTETGYSYGAQTSTDLDFWFTMSTPRPGDGSVFTFPFPGFGDRNFLRVRRYGSSMPQ